jgi:ATP-dependent DNA helicase RecG
VGETTKKIHDYPEKERTLWKLFENTPFEKRIAMQTVSLDNVLSLLDYDTYFRLTKQPLPETKRGILDRLCRDKLIVAQGDYYDITNFGALLFARALSQFETLGRKAVRVIDYQGNNGQGNDRTGGGFEHLADSGYAAGFEALIAYILSRFSNNEHIGQALRVQTEMYPQIAIRELVPNALIHQDLDAGGDSPFVEIFKDRIEITNPGRPLIDPLRFIDEPPQSRNESLAAFLRRVNICEERGSGIDKVIQAVEVFQLPPPEFSVTERHTRVYLYAHKSFSAMTSKERVRACYQHVCLMYVLNKPATNASLRTRFAFEAEDYKTVTKIISATVKEKLIKPYDPENRSPRYARYVPFWA